MTLLAPVSPPPADNPAYGYIRGLDGLRLAAVLIVVVAHFRLSAAIPGGFGVTVFFAISGFLISRLLLSEERHYGEISLPRFFARRFLRLMPPLVLVIVLTLPVYLIFDREHVLMSQILLALFYLGNVSIVANVFTPLPEGIHGYGPLWSLAVEEHFYVFFPFVLLALRGWSSRVAVLIGVLVFSLALRILAAYTVPDPESFNYYFTFTRLDSIAWGCLLTFALANESAKIYLVKLRGWKTFVLAIFLLLAGIAFRNQFFQDTFRYTVHGLGMFLLINAFVFGRATENLVRLAEWRPVQMGGRISYEMYLWHLHVWFIVGLFFAGNYWLQFSTSLVLTIVVAYGFYSLTTSVTKRWSKKVGSKSVEDERQKVYQTVSTADETKLPESSKRVPG
ncbi:acyltransferase family protein [Rhizobium mesosinicum]|uniref:Acyltransferase n=1 Tax=Rhizobium mesosinicum TaxID=335017 RepID=A0ABS7H1B6_9HYPH|nr:acyltransferase [Rhizobium mesosinicum]MBW9055979.1 acyltransferase [Rhizobium mesosinicum]